MRSMSKGKPVSRLVQGRVAQACARRDDRTDHLALLCTLFDVHDKLLFLLLELCAFAIELALGLCEGALVLAQPLRWRHGSSKESFLIGTGIAV